jgi:hypothetical protein
MRFSQQQLDIIQSLSIDFLNTWEHPGRRDPDPDPDLGGFLSRFLWAEAAGIQGFTK